MKKKLIILTLIVAITVTFLGFAQFSYAQQGNTSPGIKQKVQQQTSNEFREMMKKRLDNNPAAKMKELIESFNLTKEQKTEIRKIDLNFQKELIGLRNDIEINQLEIKILFLETEPNLTKIRAKLQEIADLQTELKMKGIEEYLEVKGILTLEQQEKLPEGIPFRIFTFEKLFGTIRTLGNLFW
ncbi:MAG: periplasmic heavy metal sensor [Candidatus Caldatribacteriota bacterium]|nr:periplasmic heavy metal sensor [Candidatus Caldatribacteriota bacterium]